MCLRQLIASKQPSYELSGEVEADESYFGGVRKAKRGRGAAGKVAVFVLPVSTAGTDTDVLQHF
jgi:transposase